MVEFKRKERDYRLELKILEREYVVTIAPTSDVLLKKLASARAEGATIMEAVKAANLDETLALIDKLMDRNKEIVDLTLPGKWDELYAGTDGDFLELTEITAFIVHNVLYSATKSKLAAVAPVGGNGEAV